MHVMLSGNFSFSVMVFSRSQLAFYYRLSPPSCSVVSPTCFCSFLLTSRRAYANKSQGNVAAKEQGGNRSKYSQTVNLPKSNFPVVRREWTKEDYQQALERNVRFYERQIASPDRADLPWFRLLDGPPYANGPPHVGHALNRIMKDVIVRFKASRGHRVRFRPGWDCHGLPIELAAQRESMASEADEDAIEVRRRAKRFAISWVDEQRTAFQRWSCVADWRQPYLTIDTDYEVKQLELFGQLYDKGLIYRAYRPIYWSPSSRTALAESELEYNDKHRSTAVHFRFMLINFPLDSVLTEAHKWSTSTVSVYGVIWTTTPWTLPMNNAICFNPTMRYIVAAPATSAGMPLNWRLYVAAERAEHELKKALNVGELKVFGRFDGARLNDVFYSHPLFLHAALPFYPSKHVSADKGTGLVHTAFAHGFDDFAVANEHNERVECFVDDQGKYTRAMRPPLYGKSVLGDGQDAALSLLAKHVLHSEPYEHSYPYDWRTKQPVIIRSSKQWFVDTDRIRDRVLELFNRSVTVTEGGRNTIPWCLSLFPVGNRPAWCISRQRIWGVPIPVFYRTDDSTEQPIVNADTVRHVMNVFRQHGGADSWWTLDNDTLLPQTLRADGVAYRRGNDVMDVWFDSGAAWRCSVGDTDLDKPFDLVLEGIDQFRGWFQSSLLLAVATEDRVPFETILYHGFVGDDNDRKMSKSEGNVVNPNDMLKQPAVGVDGLRLWAAKYSLSESARAGPVVVKKTAADLKQIRLTCRFIFGSNADFDARQHSTSFVSMEPTDRYMLYLLTRLFDIVETSYDSYAFQRGVSEIIQFINGTLSAFYLTAIKDSLYCDSTNSPRRRSTQTVLDVTIKMILQLLSPILPDLVSECAMYVPGIDDTNLQWTTPPMEWRDQASLVDIMENTVLPIRDHCMSLLRQQASSGIDQSVNIIASPITFDRLVLMQSEPVAFNSALNELLKVSCVTLKRSADISNYQMEIEPCHCGLCLRCRRNCVVDTEADLCCRCADAVSLFENEKAKMDILADVA